MGTGKHKEGASKGRTNRTGFNLVEEKSRSFGPSYTSAHARKAARRGGTPPKREQNPKAKTRPGRRKN